MLGCVTEDKTPPDPVLDWLYVGTWVHARNKEQLAELGIQFVLDVENGGRKPEHLDPEYYAASPMCDFGATELASMLDVCFEFIEKARAAKSKILVQCEWGINRSATVTVAYLVKHQQMPLRDALALCFAKRPATRPRDLYLSQLLELSKKWRPDDTPPTMEELLSVYDQETE